MTLVSVVVPLYDKGPYVQRCLNSVLSQTFTRFEVIVVDDGSRDSGPAVVEAFTDKRIRLIRQANAGVSAARNRGLRESSSPLIAFLDADDEWMPQFLEAVVSLADEFPDAGLMASGFRRCRYGRPDLDISLSVKPGQRFQFSDYLRQVLAGDFVHSSCVLVRCGVFSDIGGFPAGQPIGEDIDLWARVSLRHPFAYDRRILAVYHSECENRSFDRWRNHPPFPPVVKTLRNLVAAGEVPPDRLADVLACIDFRLIKHAQWLLHIGQRTALVELLAGNPWNTRFCRTEAFLLRAALRILPIRVVYALRWKLAPLWTLLSRECRKRKFSLTADRRSIPILWRLASGLRGGERG